MIEVATYRYGGHSMSDPGTSYRTREEIQEVRKSRDPINNFKNKILTADLTTEEELKEIDKAVRKEVDEAGKAAQKDPVAPIEALYTDIFANTPKQFVRCATLEDSVIQPYTTSAELLEAMKTK